MQASTAAAVRAVAEAELAPAPKLRRILAWLTDLAVTIALSMTAVGCFGFFLPPDSAHVFAPILLGSLALGIVYHAYATPLFGNSLGKSLFGLRIVANRRGHDVSFGQWTRRLLVGALWPINAITMLASDDGRHLGDRAADTRVVLARRERAFWVGLVAAIVVIVVSFEVAGGAMKLSIINASVCKTARAHLAEQHPNARVAAFPSGFQLVNDEALFDFRVGEEWDRVILERHGGTWQVTKSGAVDAPFTGVGIRFGSAGSTE